MDIDFHIEDANFADALRDLGPGVPGFMNLLVFFNQFPVVAEGENLAVTFETNVIGSL